MRGAPRPLNVSDPVIIDRVSIVSNGSDYIFIRSGCGALVELIAWVAHSLVVEPSRVLLTLLLAWLLIALVFTLGFPVNSPHVH